MNKLVVFRTEDKKFSGKVTEQDKKRGAGMFTFFDDLALMNFFFTIHNESSLQLLYLLVFVRYFSVVEIFMCVLI